MRMTLLLLCMICAPALAREGEDAAHRADRLQTQRLNRAALGTHGSDMAVRPADGRAYARAQADYRRRLDAWRRQVAACEAGDYSAC